MANINVLILELGPRSSSSGNSFPQYPGFENDVFNTIKDYFTSIPEPIIPCRYSNLLLSLYSKYLQKIRYCHNLSTFNTQTTLSQLDPTLPFDVDNELNLPANCVYETAFESVEPVTKIVPIDELAANFPSLVEHFQKHQVLSPPPKTVPKRTEQQMFPSKLCSSNSDLPMTTSKTFQALSTIPRKSSKHKKSQTSMETSPMKSDILYSIEDENNNRSSSNPDSSKNVFYEAIQLVLVIIPSANRRHLHLLVRMFYKILHNKDLCLLTSDSEELKRQVREQLLLNL